MWLKSYVQGMESFCIQQVLIFPYIHLPSVDISPWSMGNYTGAWMSSSTKIRRKQTPLLLHMYSSQNLLESLFLVTLYRFININKKRLIYCIVYIFLNCVEIFWRMDVVFIEYLVSITHCHNLSMIQRHRFDDQWGVTQTLHVY